jgi:HK97 family phage major capsid protein
MPTVKELREKRTSIWAQAQEFNQRHEAGEDMSAEDEAAWSRALSDVDALALQINNRETNATLEKRFEDIDADTVVVEDGSTRGADDGDRAAYRSAFEKYCRFGMQDITAEERALLQENFSRAQGTTSGAAGGYTVPEGFWAKVTETQKFYGGVQGNVEEITTDSGNDLPWPTNDDTGNKGAILAENTQITEQAVVFGGKELGAYTYTSKLILVALQLLQDTGIDLEGFLARRMGERLGRIHNEHLTVGTGASQPQGFITGATVGKTTAGATAITYNEIVDLIHSVDVAYRNAGALFEMNDLVLAYVRKIRDDSGGAGLGRPIWEPSAQVGVPDSLLGYKVVVNNDMASTVATTNKTIAFGDFRAAYVARRVNGGQVMRLAERYADYLQVGFFGRPRRAP